MFTEKIFNPTPFFEELLLEPSSGEKNEVSTYFLRPLTYILTNHLFPKNSGIRSEFFLCDLINFGSINYWLRCKYNFSVQFSVMVQAIFLCR